MNRSNRVYANEMLKVHVVYVIHWNDGTSYIGQTYDYTTRMESHFSSRYAKWHGGVKSSRILAGSLIRSRALELEKIFTNIYRARGFRVFSR